MNTEVITTRTAKISQIAEEILRVEVLESSDVKEEDALENYLACKKMARGRKVAILIDSRTQTTASNEARAFSSGAEVSKLVIARAILIDSLAVKLLGNFYILVNKPHSPTRLFKEEKEAMVWLEESIQNSNRYHSSFNTFAPK